MKKFNLFLNLNSSKNTILFFIYCEKCYIFLIILTYLVNLLHYLDKKREVLEGLFKVLLLLFKKKIYIYNKNN